MFKGLSSLLVVASLVAFVGCGKKGPNTKPINSQKPQATTNNAAEAAFNGEWITDCLADGMGNYQVIYFYFNDGGVYKEISKYSDASCDYKTNISVKDLSGSFTVSGDSTSINGAKNIDITINGNKSYDLWYMDEGIIQMGAFDSVQNGNSPGARPTSYDSSRVYYRYN